MKKSILIIAVIAIGLVVADAAYLPQGEVYDSQIGKTAKVSPCRELAAALPEKQVGSTFTSGAYDTNFWTATTNGGATYTLASGEMDLVAATGPSTSTWVSVRSARYVAGSANFYRGVLRCYETNAPFGIRQWGAFDTNNGVFFQMSNNVLSACTRKNGVDTITPSSSWTTSFDVNNVTNACVYEIWWGNKSVWYFINDALVYTFNAITSPWGDPQGLKVTVLNKNVNTNGSGVVASTLECRSSSIYGFNQPSATMFQNMTNAATRTCKTGNGILHRIMINASTSATVVTIYDSTTAGGTKIGTITVPANNLFPGVFAYGLNFFNGLTVVTAGSSTDITVVYE